jgi:lipopolysaccharide export system protein LptC
MDRRRALFDRLVAWSPVFLLGGLAGLTYWLDAQVQAPTAHRDGSARHDPDLFLQDFRAVTFDEHGRPSQSLAAAKAEHFPDNDTAELVDPRLSLTQPGQPRLTITADRGVVSGDREHGDFQGAVRVVRDADPAPAKPGEPPAGPLSLSTNVLHVSTRDERVTTDQPVTIEEPRGIIHGRGLVYDNKTKQVRIESQVSGTLAPRALPDPQAVTK